MIAFSLIASLVMFGLAALFLLWLATDGQQHEDPIRICSRRLPNSLGEATA